MKFLSDILAKAGLIVDGTTQLNTIANATIDTDKFLVSDGGVVKYRTGAEVAADIGAGNIAASVLKHEVKLGESISKGQAVYVSSADGTNMIVSKASNASEATSSKTLGLLETGGSTNAKVNVVTEGLLSGLNTSTATIGDPVWLGTSGNLIFGLANKPYAPAHLVFIGIVTRVNLNNGEIFVKVQNGFELKEIHDVQITTTPSDNSVLSYEFSTGLYKMKSIATILGYTPANNATTLTINGTTYDLSANRTWSVGTVTSVGLSAPTGFSVGSSPVTGSGTIALSFASGYSLPTTTSQSNWDTAYNNRITSLTTTGTSGAATLISNVLNIPQYQAQGNYITSLTGEATASGPGAASVTLSTSAVTGKVLTGLNITGGTVLATDSILTAFGKLQNQVNGLAGGVTYQGTWDASINSPALTSSVGTKGYYYVVSVAGSTNLNGVTSWNLGDWAIFNGSTWEKVDNTDAVVSVNGFTGAVSLTTTNISEGTNLYYTDTRARAAISLTTTGTSGAATYSGGVLNIPQYSLSGIGGVPTTRQLTINGTTYDLSADRTWSVGTVTGTGTTNYVAKFTSSSAVGNSQIFDDGTNVGIGTINPTKKLDVNGDALINSLTVGRGNYNYLLNAAFGYGALGSNVSGTMVTAVGGEALTSNTSGSNNTAVGESALGFNTTGGSNTAVGVASLQYNLSGAYSTAVGQGSLQNNTASYNTAVGSQSSLYNSSGTYNTAIGAGAIAYVNTGSNNTALGYRAGYSPVNVGQYNQTPSNSVYLGYQTRAAGNGNNTNEIVIGASADGNGSNSVTIGNTKIGRAHV